jgi:N-acetylglucosaminyldiphosphoundecaprenol N-acetyl-beta-D-mannosaminyltransferase
MNSIVKSSFFSYKLFADCIENIPILSNGDTPFLISTINPHSFYVADHDDEFKTALKESEILLPDGVGIVYANWIVNRSKLRKISGMDIFLFLLKSLEAIDEPAKKRIFFLGSTESTLALIREKIKSDFPSLTVKTYSPPFKPHFNETELNLMIETVNQFSPYILFVGMTAPKQEKWAHTNKNQLNVNFICAVGAVFDFYSGNITRPGPIWQKLGLEWFGRFIREPRRLWRRYLISLPYFIAQVFIEAIKRKP